MLKRFGLSLLIAIISVFCLEVSGQWIGSSEISFVSSANAIVGRPLTPISVAGVARRTVRRCAVGVYNC
jgi:hypothetical protein